MNKEYKDDEYEKICYLCRRPESKAGKMITMPGNICVCADCMQKTFDTVSNTDLSNFNMGAFTQMFPNNQTSKEQDKKEPTVKEGDESAITIEPKQEGTETKEEKDKKNSGMTGIPNISFLNLADLNI